MGQTSFYNGGMVAPSMPPVQQVDPRELEYKAYLFQTSRKMCVSTFVVGFLLWPLWIVTYLEREKMRKIKDELYRMGVNIPWWQSAYNCPDFL